MLLPVPSTKAKSFVDIRRLFTAGLSSFDEGITWAKRSARITDTTGKVVFGMNDVEAPENWSQIAVDIAASKYFRKAGVSGAGHETSVRQLVLRLADSISGQAMQQELVSREGAEVLRDEIAYLLVHQYVAFNSPVWFNAGLREAYGATGSSSGNWRYDRTLDRAVQTEDTYTNPPLSACFIQTVNDSLMGIADAVTREMRVFKGGGGSGMNYSNIRGEGEQLSGGGTSSGLMSFLDIFDKAAGATKSGGTTRRAARMVVVNADHPDVESFIDWKVREEEKVRALVKAGYSPDFNGEAYRTVSGQNANNSIRVTDDFMRAYEQDGDWNLIRRTDGKVAKTIKARALMKQIATAAWKCADPGMQYDTTINEWHTTPKVDRINASNPCSEYMHVDNSACNLASLNLVKFLRLDKSFDFEGFEHAIDVFITAMDAIVDYASYPTKEIAENSHNLRQLGLGYANLGALLMRLGMPYDSASGRALCAALTAIMTGRAYRQSALLAKAVGPFAYYAFNSAQMLAVIAKHEKAIDNIPAGGEVCPWLSKHWHDLLGQARLAWSEAYAIGRAHGYRNAQASVLAPTGTIGLLMDCDTTGIEPDFALVKYKKLAGGGSFKIVNGSVRDALDNLGYTQAQIDEIVKHVETHDTIEGAPHLTPEHLPVFDCANRCGAGGKRFLAPMSHVKMMAAAQPFLSGAISKCVTGDTIVATSNGLVRIGDLYNGQAPDTFRELDLTVDSIGGRQKATSFYYGGVRDVWTVRLADGRSVRGTAPHRLRVATPDGLAWKELPELDQGDFVAVKLGSESWGMPGSVPPRSGVDYGSQKQCRWPNRLDDDTSLMLGMLAADGGISRSNWTVTLTKNSPAVLARFEQILKASFGLSSRRVEDSRNGATSQVVSSKTFVEWLDAAGFSKSHVPPGVLSGTRSGAASWLSGFYLDGYISKIGDVAVSQKSRTILEDVQIIWGNMGVHTYFTDNFVNGDNYPVLHISGGFRRQAADQLEWIEEHKKERAADLTDGQDRRLFPMHRDALVKRISDTKQTQRFGSVLDARTTHIRRSTFLETATKVGFSITDEEQGYTFVPVVSVEMTGQEEVYDLSVPETEAFVANGIMNHNTVNVPQETTVEEIERIYVESWKRGLKAVAIYRDGSKLTAVLSGSDDKTEKKSDEPARLPTVAEIKAAVKDVVLTTKPLRRRLPKRRSGFTQEVSIAQQKLYLRTGEYEDGSLGEVFLDMHKQGSTTRALLNSFAILTSIALQHGVPLEEIASAFVHTKFEPRGMTFGDPNVRMSSSILDYVFRALSIHYLGRTDLRSGGDHSDEQKSLNGNGLQAGAEQPAAQPSPVKPANRTDSKTAETCAICGDMMIRSGSCFRCNNCGTTSGCS